ncbi:MAG: thioredoxin [Saprospirales bacterium]|nr:MAG: thioredoxin [Saprospirales bacterium]
MKLTYILFLSVLLFIGCIKDDDQPTNLIEVDSFEMYQSIRASGVNVVFFYSPTSTVCRMQRPALEDLVGDEELPGVKFYQTKNEGFESFGFVFGVSRYPVIVFHKNSSEQARLTGGGHSSEKIKEILVNLID